MKKLMVVIGVVLLMASCGKTEGGNLASVGAKKSYPPASKITCSATDHGWIGATGAHAPKKLGVLDSNYRQFEFENVPSKSGDKLKATLHEGNALSAMLSSQTEEWNLGGDGGDLDVNNKKILYDLNDGRGGGVTIYDDMTFNAEIVTGEFFGRPIYDFVTGTCEVEK